MFRVSRESPRRTIIRNDEIVQLSSDDCPLAFYSFYPCRLTIRNPPITQPRPHRSPFHVGRRRHSIGSRIVVLGRRGRRYSYICDAQGKDIWDKTGLRHWWGSCAWYLCTYCYEFSAGCHLFGCIFLVPMISVTTFCTALVRHMVPTTRLQCLRSASETVLLCSMWQGYATNWIALLGWFAWFCNLHCSCAFNCRGCTWFKHADESG